MLHVAEHATGNHREVRVAPPIRLLSQDCIVQVAQMLSFNEALRAVYAGCFPYHCIKQVNVDGSDDERMLLKLLSSKQHSALGHVKSICDHVEEWSLSSIRVYFLSELPSTLTELSLPQHKLCIKSASIHLPNLSVLNVHDISISLPVLEDDLHLQTVTPSLTSLRIGADTESDALLDFTFGGAMARQLCFLHMHALSWYLLDPTSSPLHIRVVGDIDSWPALHTLVLRELFAVGDQGRSCPIPTNDVVPSLTKLAISGINKGSLDLDQVGRLTSLEHLELTFSDCFIERDSLTRDMFPPFLTRLEWKCEGGTRARENRNLPDVLLRLLDLLPNHLACLVLPDCSFVDLEMLTRDARFSRLNRFIAEDDEYCRVETNEGTQWQSLSLLLREGNVDLRHLYAFEMIRKSAAYAKIYWPHQLLRKFLNDALLNYPTLGVRIAQYLYPKDDAFLKSLDFSALCTLLKYSTSSCRHSQTVAMWIKILRCLLANGYLAGVLANVPHDVSRVMKVLKHHSKLSHPDMFRYLLHVVYMLWSAPTMSQYQQHAGELITARLDSKFQYERAFTDDAVSALTVSSLQNFMKGEWRLLDDPVYMKNWLFAVDHPHLADLARKGEVNACKWFDSFRACRLAQLIKDTLRDDDCIFTCCDASDITLKYCYYPNFNVTILVSGNLDSGRHLHRAAIVTLILGDRDRECFYDDNSIINALQRDRKIATSVATALSIWRSVKSARH